MPTPDETADKLLAEWARELRPFIIEYIINGRHGTIGSEAVCVGGDFTETSTFVKTRKRLPKSQLSAR